MYPFLLFNHRYPYTDLQELNLDWLIHDVKEMEKIFIELGDLKDLPAYVQEYLDSIDWSGLVGTQLQAMYESGELEALIGQYIADEVTPTLDALQDAVAGLQNAASAYERDSSTPEVHALDFYYIDRTYAGESDGTQSKPFSSIDQAVEETFNKGVFAPNMRFLTGGYYSCKYAVFNAVTWHLSGNTAGTRPVLHFTAHNNITFYNSHINFAGLDVVVDDPAYLFRGENCEFHIGDSVTLNTRLQLASCGCHLANSTFETISATNTKLYMEGTNTLRPERNNALVLMYNTDCQVDGTLNINSTTSTEETKRAIMCTEHSRLFLNTSPVIGAGYTYDLRLSNADLKCEAATYAGFTSPSLGGLYTLQTVAQTINS